MKSRIVIPVTFDKRGTACVENGKTVTIYNITDRDRTRGGVVHRGQVRHGHHVEIQTGESVRLFGQHLEVKGGSVNTASYDLTFRLGDQATYDAYNFVYTGEIIGITAKTITIQDKGSQKLKKLSLYEFSWRNERFNLKDIQAENDRVLSEI